METLTRRFNTTFGTWSGLKHSLRHGKSLSNIVLPAATQQNWSEEPEGRHQRPGHSRTASAASGHGSLGSVASRSVSLNSISSEGSFGEPSTTNAVDQEDIVALTQHVRSFKDALGRLRRIFHPQCRDESIRISAHEKLGEVLRILRHILEKYGALQSTELLTAAGQLIKQIKSLNFEDEKTDPTEFFEAIDKLALAFSSRVSEYLMGDLDTSSAIHPAARTRSCENLSEPDLLANGGMNKLPDVLSPQQIDETLMRLEHGVGVALQRAKIWAKYAKDVMMYIEKRSTLEAEYSRNIAKLAQSMRSVLKEENFLPFQSVYSTALNQDVENANLSQATCSLLLGHKFIEPLNSRRNDHEKTRKNLKDIWQKELKKTQEAVNNLRKARALYYQRQQEYEKAKETLQRIESLEGTETSKLDKKKRLEDEALQKAMEAETTYKACVVEANERHQNLQKVKADVLKQVRELILQCDQTMKAATVGYFQLQHTVSAPAPVQFQSLCEDSRTYEPGTQYMEYIKRLPVNPDVPVIEPPPFSFEPYIPTDSRLQERRANGTVETSDECSGGSNEKCAKSKPNQCAKMWGQSGLPVNVSDSDSMSSQSNKSVDTSPYSSPMISSRHRIPSTHDEFDLDPESVDSTDFTPKRLSKAAETHDFRKLKTPSKCRDCDTYVYFQGVECTECGLTSHKKCAETLAIQCGHKRLKPKLTTFGIDLSAHIAETQSTVPHLVNQCIQEIELRGMNIKGIYRVSGVKSKVEKLCQSFENGAELVDLTEIHPNVIANVLKLYFRQLPEPLLTFRLYSEFVRIAKKYVGKPYDIATAKQLSDELKDAVQRLPQPHYVTLALLMAHLKKVSESSDVNKMPPSNLGIVFGPTLLRTSEGSASLSSLVDMDHQIRVVELLIQFNEILFNDLDITPEIIHNLAGKSNNQSKSKEPLVSDDDNVISEEFSHERKYSSDGGLSLATVDDETSFSIISDDELLDGILMSDYSTKEGSLLFPNRESIQTSSKTSQSDLKSLVVKHETAEPNIYESIDEKPRPSSRNRDIFAPGTVTGDEDTKDDPPLPPPRRHCSNSRRSRSPCPSDSDSISIGSLSSLTNSLQTVETTERIVIHVQSASREDSSCSDVASECRHSTTLDSNKARPLCVIVDDTVMCRGTENQLSMQVVDLDSKTDAGSKTSTIHKFSNETENDTSPLPRSLPPTPSPRLSRMKNSEHDVRNSGINNKQHSPNRSPSGGSSLFPSTDALSPCSYSSAYCLSQPSPVPSIPSTSSSLDELDNFACLPSSSPSPNEYVSTESYRSLNLSSDRVLYAQSSAFAHFNKDSYHTQDHGTDAGAGEGIPEDGNEMLMFTRAAMRTSSCPTSELGSRNSVLRCAKTFRHQRYSPAYSTASTKSSSSSSPPPEMDEVGDGTMIDSRQSPKPIPRSSVLTTHVESSIFGTQHSSKDDTVFIKNVGHEEDQSFNPKTTIERRAPRFV